MERRFGRRGFPEGRRARRRGGGARRVPFDAEAGHADPSAERVTFDVPGLDPAHHGLRVAQLSICMSGRARPMTSSARPSRRRTPSSRISWSSRATTCPTRGASPTPCARLGGLAAPTVAVLGNHDVWVDPKGATAVLRGHGYEVLENAWTSVRLRGAPFTIVGVGDHRTRRDDVRKAVRGLTGGLTPLVLAHGPAPRGSRAPRPSGPRLSGHARRTINIPIFTPLLLATIVQEPYLRGRYALDGGVQLYVNRGIDVRHPRPRERAVRGGRWRRSTGPSRQRAPAPSARGAARIAYAPGRRRP